MKGKFKYTKFQIVVEFIALFILLAMFVYPILVWNTIPDQIPGHYNGVGEIDRWGDKKELLIIPIISIGPYLLLTAVVHYPSAWNIPVTVTQKNIAKVGQCIRSMVILMKAEVMLLFFYLTYHGIQAKPLSPYFLSVVLTVIFGTLLFFFIRLYKVSK